MKKGFTLAEVLITLGVIGVVAALTMPTLISNHQKKVVVSRLQKFYTNINQAIKLSEVDNGSCEFWDYPEDTGGVEIAKNFYNTYLKKYLKVLSEEEKEIALYSPNKVLNSKKEYYIVYFPDGSAMGLNWSIGLDIHFLPVASLINKERSSSRNDFTFSFMKNDTDNKGKCTIEPYTYKWDGTRDGLISNTFYGCSRNSLGSFCAKLIQYDGWKISDDYPW